MKVASRTTVCACVFSNSPFQFSFFEIDVPNKFAVRKRDDREESKELFFFRKKVHEARQQAPIASGLAATTCFGSHDCFMGFNTFFFASCWRSNVCHMVSLTDKATWLFRGPHTKKIATMIKRFP